MNHEQRIRDLENDIRDLQRRNDNLQRDVRDARQHGDHLQREVSTLKSQVRELESQVDKLKREVSALKQKVAELEDLKSSFEKYVMKLDWTIESPPSLLEYLFKFQLDCSKSPGLNTRYAGKVLGGKPNGPGTLTTEDYVIEGVFLNGKPHGVCTVHDKKREIQGTVGFKHGTQEGMFDWSSALDGKTFYHRGFAVDNKTEGPSYMIKANGDVEFSLFEAGMLEGESVTIDASSHCVILQKWTMNKKVGQPVTFFKGVMPSYLPPFSQMQPLGPFYQVGAPTSDAIQLEGVANSQITSNDYPAQSEDWNESPTSNDVSEMGARPNLEQLHPVTAELTPLSQLRPAKSEDTPDDSSPGQKELETVSDIDKKAGDEENRPSVDSTPQLILETEPLEQEEQMLLS